MAKKDNKTTNNTTVSTAPETAQPESGKSEITETANTSGGEHATVAETNTKPETDETAVAETGKEETSKKAVDNPAVALRDVDTLLAERNIPRWMAESIKVFAGWKTGKQVSSEDVAETLAKWNKRGQGSGRRA